MLALESINRPRKRGATLWNSTISRDAAILEDSKIAFGQIGDKSSRRVGHGHVERDHVDADAKGRHLTAVHQEWLAVRNVQDERRGDDKLCSRHASP